MKLRDYYLIEVYRQFAGFEDEFLDVELIETQRVNETTWKTYTCELKAQRVGDKLQVSFTGNDFIDFFSCLYDCLMSQQSQPLHLVLEEKLPEDFQKYMKKRFYFSTEDGLNYNSKKVDMEW